METSAGAGRVLSEGSLNPLVKGCLSNINLAKEGQ
jgi:hypothetical protein